MNPIDNLISRLQNIKGQPELLTTYQKHLLFEEISNNVDYLLILHRNHFVSPEYVKTSCNSLEQQLKQLERFFDCLERQYQITIEELEHQLKTCFVKEPPPMEIRDWLKTAKTKYYRMKEEKFYPKNRETFFRPLEVLIELIQDELEPLRRKKDAESPMVERKFPRDEKTSNLPPSPSSKVETIDTTKFDNTYKTLKERLDQTSIRFDIPLPYDNLPENLSEKKIDMRRERVPVNNKDIAFTVEELDVLKQYR